MSLVRNKAGIEFMGNVLRTLRRSGPRLLPVLGLLCVSLMTFVLSGCLDIESFSAPTTVLLGQDLTYSVSMQVLTETPPPNSSKPQDQTQPSSGWTVGVRISNNWKVLQVIAPDTQTQPVFKEDKALERLFQKNTGTSKNAVFHAKSGYHWWVGRIDVNDLPQDVKINGTLNITMHPWQHAGKYLLDFQTGGYNFKGNLYFNDKGQRFDVPVTVVKSTTLFPATPAPTVRPK